MRGYYQADTEDHLIVSADWSAVELVRIGALSKDPEFIKAYGQRPHADLHSSAAAGVLKIPLEEFLELPNRKDLRGDLGKGSNFEYWYSGLLMQTASAMGWSFEEMWEATEGYRTQFSVGEQWRIETIAQAAREGKLSLEDGLTRYLFESTPEWANLMMDVFSSFGSDSMINFGRTVIKRIQKRTGNRGVNFMVQGGCGSLIKKTILKIHNHEKFKKFDARFMLPIHDELLFSVHKDDVFDFVDFLKQQMIENDDEFFSDVELDSSIAVGYNFAPFGTKGSARYGQIELSEINRGVPCVPESSWGNPATLEERKAIIDYLTHRENYGY